MLDFDGILFQPCGEWIATQLNDGKSWEDIYNLCSDSGISEELLCDMSDNYMWPEGLSILDWTQYVDHYKETHITIALAESEPVIAIDNGYLRNHYQVPVGTQSSWEQYKLKLQKKMSPYSVGNIQKSCNWVLTHLSIDTSETGAIKGLVTGSVQSGKTANMEGLVSMAADYDWNFFIILSGTIDNLRKQTRDRFRKDLCNSEGILWRILDFAGEDKHFQEEELKLNPLIGSKCFATRYVTVCLKNKKRLEKLIDWLHDDPKRTSKLRILVIDDEADQASINTAEITPEEEQERCAINQLICNLVNGRMSDGTIPQTNFQAINYISFTATPYANVLNEAGIESLYPKDFVCTLPEAHEYFGAKVIFGNNEQGCPGFPILREISSGDSSQLKAIQKEKEYGLPESLKEAIAWFLCAVSVLRLRKYRKSVSMLVHTSPIQKEHFVLYNQIMNWIKGHRDEVMKCCMSVYEKESCNISKADLLEANPEYGWIDSVSEEIPAFLRLIPELNILLDDISNILLGEDKKLEYSTGVHVCVDNCSANKEAEEGTYLRIVYPDDDQLEQMEKAPAFLVIGGNTLSRGLTIDGLLCTYFSRTSNQADTLMQMARWFGYRKGYELLQRIWMTDDAKKKFKALAKIEMDLKNEIEIFMERGISPSKFGPRIRNTPEIAKFRITAKKKSQRAEYADFDFCGDSYETTNFEDNDSLAKNLKIADDFILKLNGLEMFRKSEAAKAFIWDDIRYEIIRDQFLKKYEISQFSSLLKNLPYFMEWMEKENQEGKFTRWNVAVVDGDDHDTPWDIGSGATVGKIERTCKDVENPIHIDIGSLRSGRDAICDVNLAKLSLEQLENYKKTRKNGKNIIAKRCCFGLEDNPLLLIYRIKSKSGQPKSGHRHAMDIDNDIIGISIIVSGDSIGETHAKSLRIMI